VFDIKVKTYIYAILISFNKYIRVSTGGGRLAMTLTMSGSAD